MSKLFQRQPNGRIVYRTVGGFSLLEILIYIFILVVLLVIIMNVVVSVVGSGRTIRSLRSIENSALSGLERINREVRQADYVILSSSVLDTHPGYLSLSGVDEFGNPRSVEFYLSSGRLVFSENGLETGALTRTDSRVTNLVFRRFATTTYEGIKVEITIESGTSTSYRFNNFYSSATVRR